MHSDFCVISVTPADKNVVYNMATSLTLLLKQNDHTVITIVVFNLLSSYATSLLHKRR